jgi:hypothetical protein
MRERQLSMADIFLIAGTRVALGIRNWLPDF